MTTTLGREIYDSLGNRLIRPDRILEGLPNIGMNRSLVKNKIFNKC